MNGKLAKLEKKKVVADLSNTFDQVSESSSDKEAGTFDFMKSKLENRVKTRSQRRKEAM